MTVSVVVPCLNAAPYLSECLQSLLDQAHPPDEILVVDGGSRDDTSRVFERWEARAPERLRWMDQGSIPGLAEGRNRGVAAARGEVVSFLDADARAHPLWLAEALRLLEAYPEAAAVGGQGFDLCRTPADHFRSCYFQRSWGNCRRHDVPFLFGMCSHYRRSVLLDLGLFDLRFRSHGEDLELGMRLKERGYPLVYDPNIVVYHARRDDWHTLGRFVRRWSYSAMLASLTHGGRPRSRPQWLARWLYHCWHWLAREAPSPKNRCPGWWRRPLYLAYETKACWQAQRDFYGRRPG